MQSITSSRSARRLLATSTFAQLPLATLSIALLVHTARLTGSVAPAGLVSAAYAAALGVGGPIVGRLADRRGQTGVLLASASASTVLLVAIAVLPAGTGVGLVAVLAAALGLCTPPVAACLRAALPDVLLDPAQVRTAVSLQATLSEFAWIAGPPITLGLAAAASIGDPSDDRAAGAERRGVRRRHDAGRSHRAGQPCGVDEQGDAQRGQR